MKRKHADVFHQIYMRACRPLTGWLALCTVLLGLMSGPLVAGKNKKQKGNPLDPYATAESETAPPVAVADLAYRNVLFEDFVVPPQWEAKARKVVTATEERAISRLVSTNAFATVAKKQDQVPSEPWLDIKCTLLNYRMVGGKTRFFAGAAAGTSYVTYQVQVQDGKSSSLLFQREVSTENNAFAAAFSFNDKNLPTFLGNVLADYLALRARKDKGVNVLPLSTDAPVATNSGK